MFRFRSLPFFLLVLFSFACNRAPAVPDAQSIVDAAIRAHGGSIMDNALMTFDFRGRHFSVSRRHGVFSYERTYQDTLGRSIHETLNNDGVFREINGIAEKMDSTTHHKMETSVNSVVYFALLPIPLNDPAVIKRYLGSVTINGLPYDKIEIGFQQEGGGRDYDDRFIYWFNRETHTMDYLAYYYHVNEQGSRFRKAINVRTVNGVRIADYMNYRNENIGYDDVERYDTLFQAGALDSVSVVALENVEVMPYPDDIDTAADGAGNLP